MKTLLSRAGRLLLLVSIVVGVGASAFAQTPTLSGFSPGTLGIGMPVVITGTNFTAPVTVRFNGVTASGAVLNSPTQITVPAPSPLNAGTISVQTPAGTATSAASYAVTLLPGITSFAPATGPDKRVVIITGYNFLGTGITSRSVFLNGQPVGSTSTSASTIAFSVPLNATSGPLMVQTNNGSVLSATDFIVAAGPAPANDNFANAITIAGPSGSITGNNTNATSEPGEPEHPGNGGGASVWYRWVAPTSGWFLFNPYDSSTQQYGIVQGIYTGASVDTLTLVAAGQTSSNVFVRYASAAALNAIAGTTYYIALDGLNGLMADFRLQWSVLNVPTISSFTPTTAGAGQSTTVSVSGTGFVPGATVTMAGAAVSPSRITYNNANSLSITQVPFLANTGSSPVAGPITVTTVRGTVASGGNLTVTPAPAPTITSFSPGSVAIGANVTITGTSLALGPDAPASIVRFNGVAASVVSSSSSTSVSAIVPPGASSGPISVETARGTGTSAGNLTVIVPPPTISGFTPAVAPVSALVTISGTNFSPVNQVLFNGTPAVFTVNSPAEIVATVPAGATSGPITVSTPTASATSGATFFVLLPPVITGFTPASGITGSPVTISGSNFEQVLAVLINGVATSFTADSSTQITAAIPGGPVGTGPITVITTAGTAVSAGNFTVLGNGPTITGYSPGTFTPTMLVAISGTNFTGTPIVSIGGVNAQFTLVSTTLINARVPFGVPPTGFISVTTAEGTALSPTQYALIPPAVPSISSFSPSAVAPAGSVTLNGSGFSDVTTVLFNGVPASTFTVQSPTQLIATAPSTTLTAGAITVVTSIGSATSATNYTISLAPVITHINPGAGPVGRVITVSGFNFSGTGIANQVLRVNGTPIGSFSRSATTYTFAVPAGATTGPITLQTNQGLATSPEDFVVMDLPPPANDNFANAQLISGSSGLFNGNTTNATKEPGEPNHSNNPGGASVWFTWTAPTSGLYLFNPSNSASSQFGIIQSIYTGNAVNALTLVASGQTPTSVFARFGSAAVLDAVAGTTYRIALDGYNGVMADYRLAWAPLTAPTVSGFSPGTALAGQTININVNGSQFTPGAAVTIGGVPVDVSRLNYQSATLITITQLPANAVTGPISVTTPAGTATSAAAFIVTPLAPTIVSVNPNLGIAGDSITISGTNLGTTSSVRFNGVPATFSVTNNNSLTTVVPPEVLSGDITVVTAGGSATSPTPFTVILPPVITVDPTPTTGTTGDTVSFDVGVTSNGPVTYQWLRNDLPVLGNASATTAHLTLTNVTPADNAFYRCLVSNRAGSMPSASAVLIVFPARATISFSGLSATYDGTPHPVTVTTVPAGLTVSVSYGGSPIPPTNAGNYFVTASISDPNYFGSDAAIQYIAPAPASVSLSGLGQVIYTGSPRTVAATTTPAGLPVRVTYNGSPTAPTNVGSYAVLGNISDSNYLGSASGTLTVVPAPATITLAGLAQNYDGTPKSVTATTNPANLAVTISYNGSPDAPTLPGAYPVTATLTDANHTGSANGVLVIGTTALVRRAPTLNAGLDGSIQVLSAESITLNGSAWVAGDLLVPGTPDVRQNGHPTYAGTVDANGGAAPSNYSITLNGSAVLRHVVRRVDPRPMPVVAAPPISTGTRNVVLNSSGQNPGDFATLQNLTLNGNAGSVAVPPGTYGTFIVNGNARLVFGVAGSASPSIYNLKGMVLNGSSELEIAGPVVITLATGTTFNGNAGSSGQPEWLTLNVASGDVTINGNGIFNGSIVVPNGTINLNGKIRGTTISSGLTINGNGLLQEP